MGRKPTPSIEPDSLKQTEDGLRQLLGLSQNRSASLLQNLILAQIRGFRREIGILNAASSCRYIFGNVLQVGDRVIKPILDRTKGCALGVDVFDRIINGLQHILSGQGSICHIYFTDINTKRPGISWTTEIYFNYVISTSIRSNLKGDFRTRRPANVFVEQFFGAKRSGSRDTIELSLQFSHL